MNKSNPEFSSADIEQLTKDFELAMENDNNQTQVLPTRASVKRQFANLSTDTLAEAQAAFETLDEQLGNTDTTLRQLSYQDVDDLVEELLVVRRVGDILSAREDTLKTFAKDVISMDQIDPDKTNGSLVSSKHKLKISKEIRGGKLSIDIALLKKRLTGEQFSSVVNVVTTTVATTTPDGKMDEIITTTHEVNEKFLEAEMVKGNILSEDVFLSSVESKRTSAIYLRDLED
jgi:hypothetical protein